MQSIFKKILILLLIIIVLPLSIYLIYKKTSQIDKKEDVFQKYAEYVLDKTGTELSESSEEYEYISTMLEDVVDVVDEYDKSNLEEIKPIVGLPSIDLKENNVLSYDIDEKNKIHINYTKPKDYTEPLSMILLNAEVLHNEKKITDVIIRENTDFTGEATIYTFNNQQLKYPILIIGEDWVSSSREEIGIFFLIDGEFVRYKIKMRDQLSDTFRSTVEIGMYLDKKSKEPYLFSHWEDPAFLGFKTTKWNIDHDERIIELDYSVIEKESNY